MSKEAVNQFLQKVTENSQLQQELTKVLEAGNDQQAVTDLAVKHGYQFTADEFKAEIDNRQSDFQQRQAAGELNEEELEAVAGGAPSPDQYLDPTVSSASTTITLNSWKKAGISPTSP